MTRKHRQPPCDVVRILMERDGLHRVDAEAQLAAMRQRVLDGENPEVVLEEDAGLEPDYLWDLV